MLTMLSEPSLRTCYSLYGIHLAVCGVSNPTFALKFSIRFMKIPSLRRAEAVSFHPSVFSAALHFSGDCVLADGQSTRPQSRHSYAPCRETPSQQPEHRPPLPAFEDVHTAQWDAAQDDAPSGYSEPAFNRSDDSYETQRAADAAFDYSVMVPNELAPFGVYHDAQPVRAVAFDDEGELFAVGSNSKTLLVCSTQPQPDGSLSVLAQRAEHHFGYCCVLCAF